MHFLGEIRLFYFQNVAMILVMGAENTKIIEFPHHLIRPDSVDSDEFAFLEPEDFIDPADVLDLEEFRHPEEVVDPETELLEIRKAKIAIVGWMNGGPVILELTRSQSEHTRKGGPDFAGGKLNPGEDYVRGLRREVEREELRGIRLGHIVEIGEHSKLDDDGVYVSTKIYAGTANILGTGFMLSSEHSAYGWPALSQFPRPYLPDKYNDAVTSDTGLAVINGLAELVADRPVPSRHDLTMVNFLATQASTASMQYMEAA